MEGDGTKTRINAWGIALLILFVGSMTGSLGLAQDPGPRQDPGIKVDDDVKKRFEGKLMNRVDAIRMEKILERAEFKPLFDGKTLDGWIQRGGHARYSVEDGCIVGRTVPKTPNSFLCTGRDYDDFVLEYEFKVDPRLNSGVQIRSESRLDYMNGRVHGYQVEIDPDMDRARLWTAGIYDEARAGVAQ